ncbi:MAG: hypothetical protein NVV70_16800 [Cellulomonas sp.]|nr:hypothetical protein [Cellulomonas sp.]MCR6649705.1 hypothetical protein [Cellulomonas sp.]
MTLIETTGPLTAVVELLGAHLPAHLRINPPDIVTGGVAVEHVTTPVPQVFAALGGPDKASMAVQVTVVDSTRDAVRLAGDRVRTTLTGVNHRNKPLWPLQADGYVFDPPTTWGDGAVSTASGIHSHVETFTLTWQYRPGVTPPS